MSLPEDVLKKWREQIDEDKKRILGTSHSPQNPEVDGYRIEQMSDRFTRIIRAVEKYLSPLALKLITAQSDAVRTHLIAVGEELDKPEPERDYRKIVEHFAGAFESMNQILFYLTTELVDVIEKRKSHQSASPQVPPPPPPPAPPEEARVVELLRTLPPEFRIERVQRVGVIRPRLRVIVSTRVPLIRRTSSPSQEVEEEAPVVELRIPKSASSD